VIPDYSSDSTLYHVVISRSVAQELSLGLDDRVLAYFFTEGNIRTRRVKVAGIYNSHFNEFDHLMGFMSIDALRPIASMETGRADAVEIRSLKEDDIAEATRVMMNVATEAFYANTTDNYLSVNDVYSRNPMYFNWLDLLDTNVIVIMVLMGIVSAVTLISCLFIMILERVRLIGILKALGADNDQVSRIFLFMAERVVLRGILAGDVIGLLLVWLQWQFHLLPLDPEAYYLNSVPVEFNWTGILILNAAAIALSLIIMLLPTRTVSRISPARVIRFE
ncbi:MAG: FtsX-like permease family protein, partial [Muribaculaceae bacterium]|nr:FtsX-like permease family protein [Muribaculaceae bacterium]